MGNCLITRKGSNVKLEGNATQEDVLLNKTFYANDKNIKSGTMNNNGAISANVAINGEYTIPKGYHDGNGKVIGPKIIHNIYTNLSANSEVIDTGKDIFTYIHEKTTPIKDIDNDIVFTMRYSEKPNINNNITRPFNKTTKNIYKFFQLNKVFYQDNTVGEIVRNYLIQCTKVW